MVIIKQWNSTEKSEECKVCRLLAVKFRNSEKLLLLFQVLYEYGYEWNARQEQHLKRVPNIYENLTVNRNRKQLARKQNTRCCYWCGFYRKVEFQSENQLLISDVIKAKAIQSFGRGQLIKLHKEILIIKKYFCICAAYTNGMKWNIGIRHGEGIGMTEGGRGGGWCKSILSTLLLLNFAVKITKSQVENHKFELQYGQCDLWARSI